MAKYIPVSSDGRFLLRVGKWTKAEEDEFFSRQGGPVAFTRPAPSPVTTLPGPESSDSVGPRRTSDHETALARVRPQSRQPE